MEKEKSGITEEKIDGKKVLIAFERVSGTGMFVTYFADMDVLFAGTHHIRNLCILVLLITVVACFVISYYVTVSISDPVKELVEVMQETGGGKWTARYPNSGNDELTVLGERFNEMADKTDQLIEQVYRSEIRRQEISISWKNAQLSALLMQINPHFLYNTLSLINWKALAAGEEDISRMTLALSTFYRTALNRGRNVLQVETELSNTRAYLEIQSMLHDGDFDYEIEAQTEILQCESLNLILQPLVENAIHHGIEEKTDGRGKITVRGWKEDNCVWFMVEDNGVGMEQEVADKILTMESKGYGVRNVDERIRLCYGEKYAMKVESVVGKGTKMTIHFPARRLTNIQKSQIS